MSIRDYLKSVNKINLQNVNLLKQKVNQENQQQNIDGSLSNNSNITNLLKSDFEKSIKLIESTQNVNYKDELTNLLFPYLRDTQTTNNIVASIPVDLYEPLCINFNSFVVPKLKELEGQRISKPDFLNVFYLLQVMNY